MAHHGSNPLENDTLKKIFADEDVRKQLTALEKEQNVGATGEYPEGKLDPSDEGEIRFLIAHHGQKIVLSFGKPVAWFGLSPEQAIEMARMLIKHAGEAKGVPLAMRIGTL